MTQILNDYEYNKYSCSNLDEILPKLQEYGVAIVPNIINSTECEEMKNGMWDYLEHITSDFPLPINRNNKESWKQIKNLYPKHSMLIQQWSIGHAQFIWTLREKPKIVEIFSKIWNVPSIELLTSFDGASFHMPPEITGFGWFRGKSWLHTDQSYLRNNLECIQGWVTAYDVNPGDATLTFLEGSHKYHNEFKLHFNNQSKEDWQMLQTDEQYKFYTQDKNCRQKYIQCPAGSIVLWDSRTIHSGIEAHKERKYPNQRCVAYICMTPRSLANQKILDKKKKAFVELRTTNHYPHKPKLFPKIPHTFGQSILPIKQIEQPFVGPLGLRLAGY